MSTNAAKGNELEIAVRVIEEAILHEAPGYSEESIRILGKKIILHEGVRHEIDVYVTVLHAPGYDSAFIFECKNWESKVGKNEIIVFSEKISASSAQRGYFIAKSFTRDAKAQAKKDPRIKLLTAEHYAPVSRVEFPRLHLVNTTACDANVTIRQLGSENKLKTVSMEGKEIIKNSQSYDAKSYFDELVRKACDSELSKTATNSMTEGVHQIEFHESCSYSHGELLLDDVSVETITIQGKATIEIAKASIISVYEVESRGRVIRLGMESNGVLINAQFVELTGI